MELLLAFSAAACRVLPFGFQWKSTVSARHRSSPLDAGSSPAVLRRLAVSRNCLIFKIHSSFGQQIVPGMQKNHFREPEKRPPNWSMTFHRLLHNVTSLHMFNVSIGSSFVSRFRCSGLQVGPLKISKRTGR